MDQPNRNEGFGCIYRIWHKASGKSYIGQTIQLDTRIKTHFNLGSKCPYLSNAIKKHGREAFNCEVLDNNIPVDDLDKIEMDYIIYYDAFVPNGYNLTRGGHGVRGYKHTDEAKKKISEANTGHKHNIGRKHTEVEKKKIGDANRGRKRTEEVKKKMGDVRRGRKHTNEAKKKISESNRRRKYTEETRKKISDSRRGIRCSEDTKKKIGDANRGRKHTEEAKKKMSENRRGIKHSWQTREKIAAVKKGKRRNKKSSPQQIPLFP